MRHGQNLLLSGSASWSWWVPYRFTGCGAWMTSQASLAGKTDCSYWKILMSGIIEARPFGVILGGIIEQKGSADYRAWVCQSFSWWVSPPHGHTISWWTGSNSEKTPLAFKQTVCPHHKTRKYAQTKKSIVFFLWVPYRFSRFHSTTNIRCTLECILNQRKFWRSFISWYIYGILYKVGSVHLLITRGHHRVSG